MTKRAARVFCFFFCVCVRERKDVKNWRFRFSGVFLCWSTETKNEFSPLMFTFRF